MLVEQNNVVSVWLGHYEQETEWTEYVREQYEDETRPLNDFAGEFGLGSFYDHDMQEMFFYPTGDATIDVLIGCNSYSASFVDAVVAAAHLAGVQRANVSLLLYDHAYQPAPPNATGRNRLDFLGVFSYDRSAPPAIVLDF